MGYVLNLQKLEFRLTGFAPAWLGVNSTHDCSSTSEGGCERIGLGCSASSLSVLLCHR